MALLNPLQGDGKIKKESAVDKLCETIRQLILNGTWRTGEKLPTEHELADYFGLNRMTVRAALQRLNALGILETRVGDGTYVRSFDFASLVSEVSDFYETPDLMESIGEFRQVVEGGCARLIIDRGTPEEIKELRRISEELSEYMDRRRQCFSSGTDVSDQEIGRSYQLIFQFHEQLFRMTHNTLLYYAHAVSRDAVCKALMANGERRMRYFYEQGQFDRVKQHEKILAAIERKDYDACQDAITKYVGQEVAPY